MIRRAIRSISGAKEFKKRVRLPESDELLLPQLPNQRLTAKRRSAGKCAQCGFGSLPELENIRGAVFAIPGTFKPRRDRSDRSQRG
jgi:hypothetical protein